MPETSNMQFSNPQERQALINERVNGIVDNVQRLTEWGVEEAGKHSYLHPEGVVPLFPAAEGRRKGVCLYQGVIDDLDTDLLSEVYAKLGLTEARAKAQPIQFKPYPKANKTVTAFKTMTTWGVELLELEDKDEDGFTIRELWATK